MAVPRLDKTQIPVSNRSKQNNAVSAVVYKPVVMSLKRACDWPTPIWGYPLLIGLGKRGNRLNRAIRDLVRSASQEIFICTPYFNLPSSLARDISGLLQNAK